MPCEKWTSEEELCCDKTKYSSSQIADAIADASDFLDGASYRKYGICEYKIQPSTDKCSKPCYDNLCDGYSLTPQTIGQAEIQSLIGIYAYDSDGIESSLDKSDVWWEDSTIHFPKGYSFPVQQPGKIGGRNTWHITLTAGKPVPGLGRRAAKELALELLKEDCGDTSCKIPPELNRVIRQGAEFYISRNKDAWQNMPGVSKFLQSHYCRVPRWSGIINPQSYSSQNVSRTTP